MTPAVGSTCPSVDSTSPSIDSTSPSVDSTSPSVGSTSPSVDNSSPSVDSSSPCVGTMLCVRMPTYQCWCCQFASSQTPLTRWWCCSHVQLALKRRGSLWSNPTDFSDAELSYAGRAQKVMHAACEYGVFQFVHEALLSSHSFVDEGMAQKQHYASALHKLVIQFLNAAR